MVKQHIFLLVLLALVLIYSCDPLPSQPPGTSHSQRNDYGYVDEPSVSFQPNLIPIKFTVSKNGMKVSLTHSIMTYFGKFSLTYSRKFFKKNRPIRTSSVGVQRETSLYERYKFSDLKLLEKEEIRNEIINSSDIVVILIRGEDDVDVFSIAGNYKLEVISEGLQKTIVTNEYVEIDLRHSKVRELNLIEQDDVIQKIKYDPEVEAIELAIGDSVFYDSPELLKIEVESETDYKGSSIFSAKRKIILDKNKLKRKTTKDSLRKNSKSKTPY